MKKRLLLLAIIAAIISQYVPSYSQGEMEAGATPLEPGGTKSAIYIGPVLGYNRAIHTANLASFSTDPLCPFFPNGNGNGFYFGGSFEYLLGNPVNSKSSIIARVLYNSLPASFDKDGDKYPSLVLKDKSTWKDPEIPEYDIVESSTSHNLDVSYSLVTVEVMYKLNLFDTEFGITLGPTFDIPLTKKMRQEYNLIEPSNVKFVKNPDAEKEGIKYENNDRTMVTIDGDIKDPSGFRLGLKIGAQYEILMGRMYVVPAVYYNYGLTSMKSAVEGDESWNVHAIQMGVDIRFSL